MRIIGTESARAAQIGREVIETAPQKTVAAMLEGENVEQRAALILSLVAGFQMMRQAIGLCALADSDLEILEKLLTPLFERLVKGV